MSLIKKKNKIINKKKYKQQKAVNQQPHSDKRFQKASYDPKFLNASSKLTKTKADKRFSKMFKDPSFKNSSKIDRYGRQIQNDPTNKEMQQYYYLQNQQESNQQKNNNDNNISKWMQNYNQESSSEQVQDIQIQQYIDPELWSDDSQHVIKGNQVKVTKRLALCNYDWINISSKDLMILFNSFKTNTGCVKSIKVYISDFGKQKIKHQNAHGPQGIWRQYQQINQNKQKSWKQLIQHRQHDNNQAFDQVKLRKYQKQRLKYFYAVIQCDSKQTADYIYKQCDGNQFQNSNLPFDLRFVPDQINFEPSNLKEQCNQIPSTGQIKNFINRALGHSKVNLSWEDPQMSLPAQLKKKNWGRLSQQQLDKIDWSLYLNDKDLDNQVKMKQLVKQKNQEQIITDWKKTSNKKYRNNDDIEIKFQGGFQKKKNNNQQMSLKKQKKSLAQKRRQKQSEKQKRRQHLNLLIQNEQQGEFKVNLEDDRFQQVFNNPKFAIDPSDHRFDHRKSGQIFAQVVRRNKNKNE